MIKLKDLLKEEKEQLDERLTTPFVVHPEDPDQTERHWVKVFKELAKGHGSIIDYGPRESDMYDWNDRRHYEEVKKEFHAYMVKIAMRLNSTVHDMENAYKTWDKILKKHRSKDKR